MIAIRNHNTNSMKRVIIGIFFIIPFVAQCQNGVNNPPEWVKNPPTSKENIYGVGFGTSTNRDIAERKAIMDANVNLAEKVQPAVITITSQIDSVVKNNVVLIEKVQTVRKKVQATLENTNIKERAVFEDNGRISVYVLIEMPIKEINRSVVNQITDDKDLYNAIAKTKAYKQLARKAK